MSGNMIWRNVKCIVGEAKANVKWIWEKMRLHLWSERSFAINYKFARCPFLGPKILEQIVTILKEDSVSVH